MIRDRPDTDAVAAPDLVLIDARVPEPEILLAALARPCRVVRVPQGADGLAVLRRALSENGTPPPSVHLFSHGAPGHLLLGRERIDTAALRQRVVELDAIRRALAGAPVTLYGCSVGAGESGWAFVATLAAALGSGVRASSTPTGAASRGGDWAFDVAVGASPTGFSDLIERDRAALWPGLLATYTVTNTNVTGAGSLRQAIADANANAGADIIEFAGGVTGTIHVADMGSGITTPVTISEALTITGPGSANLTIATDPTITELFKIDDGDSGVLQDVSISGLTFLAGDSAAGITSNENLALTNVAVTAEAVGSSNAGVNQTGGTLTLSGTTFSGGWQRPIEAGSDVTVSTGTLTLEDYLSVSLGRLTVLTGSTFEVDSGVSIEALFGAGTIVLNAGRELVVEGTNPSTFSGVISGGGGVRVQADASLTLTGANTYTGTTTMSSGGTVSIAGDDNLGTGALYFGSTGGTLLVTGTTTIDNALVLGNGTVSAGAGADVTLSGVISDNAGSRAFTKTGTGTVTLSGANTYRGGTTVSEGTLTLSGGNALPDTGTVNVAAGATLDLNGTTETIGSLTGSGTVTVGAGSISFSNPAANSFNGTLSGTGTFSVASGVTLKGTGTYDMPVTVLSGGTIAPGNSPGTISTGNLTLASGSTASIEIDGTTAGTGYDQIAVTGTVTINGATLSTVFGFTSASGTVFTLIANDCVDAVTGTFSGLAEGASVTSGGRSFRISYTAGDGNDVTLTDITPAPESSGSGGSGGESDSVGGTAGDDTLYGNGGNDTVRGYGGLDILYGNTDNDLIYGNQSTDTLYGGQGADTLYGGQDADWICGNLGGDVIYGNKGDDRVWGDTGADTLFGGQDADTLSGGAGDDRLFGNLGADVFRFDGADGADVIHDFSSAEGDMIAIAAHVNGSGVARAADLLNGVTTDASGNAVLDLGSGNTVTLIGVGPTGLSASDFLLI
ncbi:DUF4347 domain-containing protein [Thalassobaculum sp. OXR-137]|uniref:DUF4347 domain-containing protein n=1 Tax=Thalassobaculum sp. OXR-137 TaxID=3100173 RepID=UPI002AC8F3A7|nr:DUF4347 domain-containing protein [Thalassobaculum sp. OXR-137]WPZ35013.1 DUF4347 domain-containing protein [Thalassobaculum sp. OXR-137]